MRFTLFFAFTLGFLPAIIVPSIQTGLDRVKAEYSPLRGEIAAYDSKEGPSHRKTAPLAAYAED